MERSSVALPAQHLALTPIQRQTLTPIQREVLALIRERGAISYNEIAAELYIARQSAITAVYQLEQQLIRREIGRGRVPNRYVEVLS